MGKIAASTTTFSTLAGIGLLLCSAAAHATMEVPTSLPLSVVIYYTFALTFVAIYTLAMGVTRF